MTLTERDLCVCVGTENEIVFKLKQSVELYLDMIINHGHRLFEQTNQT